MKCLVIADDEYPALPVPNARVDLLISCGDLSDRFILSVADRCCPQAVFAVKGNHDTPSAFPSPIIDLHRCIYDFGGLRFGGFGGCQRYKLRGYHLYEQHEVEAALNNFPAVDVFVAHNSPWGIHDDGRRDEAHEGFLAFNAYLKRCQPRLLVHGHQHLERESRVANSQVIGVFGHRLIMLPVANTAL